MKKQIKFSAIITIMIMVSFYGCKKDEPMEQIKEVEIIAGTTTIKVDIPDNVSVNDIEITNFSQTEDLNNAENLNITNETNVLAAINKTNGEIMYIGMYGKNNKKSTQNTEMELNSKETAIYLILQMLPIPYTELPPDKLDELKQTVEKLPGFVQFQYKVASNIADFERLAIEAIADGLIDIVKDAKNCFGIFGLDLNSDLEGLIAATGTTGTVDPAAPYFKITKGGGFQVEIKSATYIKSTKKWNLNCTFYSRKPLFYGITTSTKASDGSVSYNKDYIPYMMKPFNASAFYKSFSSCSGVANYFGDIRRAITDGADADITFDMAKTSDVEIEISDENDVVVVVAPSENLRVGVTNIVKILTNTLMLFPNPDENTKFQDFVNELLTNQELLTMITTTEFQFDYESFKELTSLILDDLASFIVFNKNDIRDIVYEVIDADNAVALAKYMKKINLSIKIAKLTSDIWMASYTWQQSKSYYFEFGFPTEGTVTDYDGNIYKTVRIGEQWWMAENLKSQHYSDGNEITGAFAYDNNESNVEIYGRLYTWDAAMNNSPSSDLNPSGVQGVCPVGWHVPSDTEWTELTTYLGGAEIAGGKMKETGYEHWDEPNEGATNESGFNALPGGIRVQPMQGYEFVGINTGAGFWTSYQPGDVYAYGRILSNTKTEITRDLYDEVRGTYFSIRCIKD